ncbi:MAG: sulfatase-like hydrolase/transferase [Chloroflexi bacterium]|nr:sulfatase-like hydrolase/transferase [Chloroflexota bacterium]
MATPPPTNILFIMTDQQRWGSLPCYGPDFIHTPNLDRPAREGMVFEQAYPPTPLCVPARGSLLTGQWTGTLPLVCLETPTFPPRYVPRKGACPPGLMR